MTKRKNDNKNKETNRVNETANQRAMKNPKTQGILNALRKGWNGMSAEQQGEQVLELTVLKCSVNGIADELGQPATTLRRRIALVKSAGTNSGWIRRIDRTLAKEPKTKSTREVADCKPSETPAKKGPGPVIKEMEPVKNEVHSSTTQQPKRIAGSSLTSTHVRPVMNNTLSEKENLPAQHESKTRLVDLYNSRGQIAQDRMQRLADIANSIPKRPDWNARSMKRQGGQ
jgi:hypothetical protein